MQKLLYELFRFISAAEYDRQKRLTMAGNVVVWCLIFSAMFGLDTNQTMSYQIFSLLLAILIISITCSCFFPGRFRARRIITRFATVGVKLKYRIIIENQTNQIQKGLQLEENFVDPRPSFLVWQNTATFREAKTNYLDQYLGYDRWQWLIARRQCGKATMINLPTLPPNSKNEVICEIMPTHRGIMRLASITVRRLDPFGLWNSLHNIVLPASILILPKLYQLPPIQLPGSRRYQSGGVALASSVGDSEEFRSLREYRPGDPLRKIHWKSWAKVGKPVVKEEQDEFFVRHALILDTFHPAPYSEILEEAVSIAASLGYQVQTQESLLDLMFVAQEAYCFTFGRGINSTDKMLEILASVVPCQDKPFTSILPVVMEKISLLSGCICIFLHWDEARKQLVDYLHSRQVYTLILIVSDQGKSLEDLSPQIMPDKFTRFHLLKLGQIGEDLMKL